MGIINWASFYLESKLKKVNSEKSSFLLSRRRVENMTFSEVNRICTLKDPKKIYGIVTVYANEKFNNKNTNYRMTEAQQELVVNTIFNSKGDTQFAEACVTFTKLSTGTFDVKDGIIENIIHTLANTEKDYQARYSGRIARTEYFQHQPYFFDLVRFIANVETLERIRDIYDKIIMLMESEFSDEEVGASIIKFITNNKQGGNESTCLKPYDDSKSAVIEFLTGKEAYSRGTSKPKIKIKTLHHASGGRPK